MNLPPLTGTYEELEIDSQVIARIAPLEPCDQPFCSCRLEEKVLLIYTDVEEDRWLVGAAATRAEVDVLLERLSDDDREGMVVNSILFGVPWESLMKETSAAYGNQIAAYRMTPTWFWERDPDELRRLRRAIADIDPFTVAKLLQTCYFAGMDPGGTRGPR